MAPGFGPETGGGASGTLLPPMNLRAALRLSARASAPALPCLVGLLLASCSSGSGEPVSDPGASAPPGDSSPEAQTAPRAGTLRSDDPRVVEVREALDQGDLERAAAGIDQAATLAGPVEGPLLRARLFAYQSGSDLDALAQLEEARRADLDDPRVAATTIEIYAWTGRLAEAEEELRRAGMGLNPSQRPPELLRALAVTILCTPGARPREAVTLIEEALERDPGLPFTHRALGQAYLLIAKELAGAESIDQALEAIDKSLEYDPADLDSRRLRAELLVAAGEWGKALEVYEELLGEGLPLEGEAADLYKRAGFWAHINRIDEELALRYLRRALELGLPREALGETERTFLADRATDRAAEAAQALADEDFALCQERLDEALLLDPSSPMARYLSGKLYIARAGEGEFEKAAQVWQKLIDDTRLDGVELPVPVHLELARHQVLGLGDLAAAKETLESYLLLEPDGRWIAETRDLLAKLPPLPPEETNAPAGEGDGGAPGGDPGGDSGDDSQGEESGGGGASGE